MSELLAAVRAAASLLVGMADECEREGKRNAAMNVREVERQLASVMSTTKATDVAVLERMVETGGGFVSHLAEAWIRADLENRARMMRTFGHYYDQYEEDLADANRRKAVAS